MQPGVQKHVLDPIHQRNERLPHVRHANFWLCSVTVMLTNCDKKLSGAQNDDPGVLITFHRTACHARIHLYYTV